MYKIKQYAYHEEAGSTTDLVGGVNIFNGLSVVQLGIQAPPATLFSINGVLTQANSGIEIGATGIFELDLKDSNTYITSLYIQLPEEYIDGNNVVKKDFDVIIDILYES